MMIKRVFLIIFCGVIIPLVPMEHCGGSVNTSRYAEQLRLLRASAPDLSSVVLQIIYQNTQAFIGVDQAALIRHGESAESMVAGTDLLGRLKLIRNVVNNSIKMRQLVDREVLQEISEHEKNAFVSCQVDQLCQPLIDLAIRISVIDPANRHTISQVVDRLIFGLTRIENQIIAHFQKLGFSRQEALGIVGALSLQDQIDIVINECLACVVKPVEAMPGKSAQPASRVQPFSNVKKQQKPQFVDRRSLVAQAAMKRASDSASAKKDRQNKEVGSAQFGVSGLPVVPPSQSLSSKFVNHDVCKVPGVTAGVYRSNVNSSAITIEQVPVVNQGGFASLWMDNMCGVHALYNATCFAFSNHIEAVRRDLLNKEYSNVFFGLLCQVASDRTNLQMANKDDLYRLIDAYANLSMFEDDYQARQALQDIVVLDNVELVQFSHDNWQLIATQRELNVMEEFRQGKRDKIICVLHAGFPHWIMAVACRSANTVYVADSLNAETTDYAQVLSNFIHVLFQK